LYETNVDYETAQMLTLTQAVNLIAVNVPIVFPPGTQLAYEGDGMQVVGRICEVVTGKDWHTIVQDELVVPLGLTNTDYRHWAVNPGIPGGSRTTPADYQKCLRMIQRNGLADDGSLYLASRTVKEWFINQTKDLPEYDSGWPDYAYPYGERPDYGHGSWIMAQNPGSGLVEEIASPGAYGTFPWVDVKRRLRGIIAMYAVGGFPATRINDLTVLDALRAEIDRVGVPPLPATALALEPMGDFLQLRWPGGLLQSSTNLSDWLSLPWARSPFHEVPTNPGVPRMFYRVLEPTAMLGSPGRNYIDPEIHSAERKITFQDEAGRIWLASLDGTSGALVPGAEIALDTGAVPVIQTMNGPEFGWDASGWAVFYTKTNGAFPSLWRATWDGSTSSALPLTSGSRRQSVLATKDTNAASIGLLYVQGTLQSGQMAWLDEDHPSVETPFGAVDDGVRWIDGTRKIAAIPQTGTNAGKVMIYDAPGNSFQTVASDAGVKTYAYGWFAPEAGGRLRVLALVDAQAVAVYEQAADSSWSRVATLSAPGRGAGWVYGSPEPFVAAGRSYVSLVIGQNPGDGSKPYYNEIWVLGMDGTAVRCDDGRPNIRRTDPEWFLGDEQVFIIYNIYAEAGFYELHRSATGIKVD
jgi:CubicO group peptidase (beta-lactamase class C family)